MWYDAMMSITILELGVALLALAVWAAVIIKLVRDADTTDFFPLVLLFTLGPLGVIVWDWMRRRQIRCPECSQCGWLIVDDINVCPSCKAFVS
jgi:hypothetical protein